MDRRSEKGKNRRRMLYNRYQQPISTTDSHPSYGGGTPRVKSKERRRMKNTNDIVWEIWYSNTNTPQNLSNIRIPSGKKWETASPPWEWTGEADRVKIDGGCYTNYNEQCVSNIINQISRTSESKAVKRKESVPAVRMDRRSGKGKNIRRCYTICSE